MKQKYKFLISIATLLFVTVSYGQENKVRSILKDDKRVVKAKIPKMPKDFNFAKYEVKRLFKVKRRKNKNLT